MVAAIRAAQLGMKTAIIEKEQYKLGSLKVQIHFILLNMQKIMDLSLKILNGGENS